MEPGKAYEYNKQNHPSYDQVLSWLDEEDQLFLRTLEKRQTVELKVIVTSCGLRPYVTLESGLKVNNPEQKIENYGRADRD